MKVFCCVWLVFLYFCDVQANPEHFPNSQNIFWQLCVICKILFFICIVAAKCIHWCQEMSAIPPSWHIFFNLILLIPFLVTSSGYCSITTKGWVQWGLFYDFRDTAGSSKTYGMGIVLLCGRDSSSSTAWPFRLLTSYSSITYFSSIQWFSHEKYGKVRNVTGILIHQLTKNSFFKVISSGLSLVSTGSESHLPSSWSSHISTS